MHLQESGEMYLESIHVLLHQRGQVRAVDVSEYMGYSKPSVSRAIGLLREGGYLTVEDGGWLHLTELGFAAAEKIYERHRVLTLWLTRIGVSRECAAEDACLHRARHQRRELPRIEAEPGPAGRRRLMGGAVKGIWTQ